MERLNVGKEAIAIKSSEKDDIEGIDLLDEGCPIEWIITKSALQEGWDCPFAYILVSLNNTAKNQTMTQLVGRVLRQPHQTRTAFEGLNESYVYCLRKRAGDISKEVKKALEKEGYEREAASLIARIADADGPTKRPLAIRDEFSQFYRQEFEGKIYLPLFCVKNGRGEPERLDYFRHLISKVRVEDFDFASIDWDLRADLAAARDQHYRLTLGQEIMERVAEAQAALLETDEQVRRWLAANLDFAHYSLRQMMFVVDHALAQLVKLNADLAGRIGLVKFIVRAKLAGFVDHETDRQTEASFKHLYETKKLCFYLRCEECRFQIPQSVEIRPTTPLFHANGDGVARSLYDYADDNLNDYEPQGGPVPRPASAGLVVVSQSGRSGQLRHPGFSEEPDSPRFCGPRRPGKQARMPRARVGQQGQTPQRQRGHDLQTAGGRLFREGRQESDLAAAG